MQARLTIEAGDIAPGQWVLNPDQVFRLGRSKRNNVVLKDQHASRNHAEIAFEEGAWILRDLKPTNPTKLNGQRVQQKTLLLDGCEIRIGDICLRFTLEHPALAPVPAIAVPPEPITTEEPASTTFELDELTALFTFMDGSMSETEPAGLVALALRTVYRQTRATVAGFLSLDEDDPLPKMTLPDLVKVDIHLSKRLTTRVQQSGQAAWMEGEGRNNDLQTESLASFRDALCVPVRGDNGEAPLGAIHVYKSGGVFTEAQMRFCEILAGYLARCLHLLRSRRALEADNSRLRVHAAAGDPDLIGTGPLMHRLKKQIRKLAGGPRVILVRGESGSGKELVALALHKLSKRCEGPLVPVNCATITQSRPESDLFGHKRGSFTGADRDHVGFFGQADMGTLFLDEIGELPEEMQAKLLRVMETGTFRPVGAEKEEKTDVRIIAATNRDLQLECREKRFRSDLLYRLGVEIGVPPLRDHLEDVPTLSEHFLARLGVEYGRHLRLSPEALERLSRYHWPGNVRQLRSVLEHAVAMCEGSVIGADDLHLTGDGATPTPDGLSLNLKELEAWAIRQALRRSAGTLTQAARLLGIHRDTLREKMHEYAIERPSQ
jgi:Nif-specific regulatory protein